MKKRKQKLINGTKNILKGEYVGNISSNYQDSCSKYIFFYNTYRGLPKKYLLSQRTVLVLQ